MHRFTVVKTTGSFNVQTCHGILLRPQQKRGVMAALRVGVWNIFVQNFQRYPYPHCFSNQQIKGIFPLVQQPIRTGLCRDRQPRERHASGVVGMHRPRVPGVVVHPLQRRTHHGHVADSTVPWVVVVVPDLHPQQRLQLRGTGLCRYLQIAATGLKGETASQRTVIGVLQSNGVLHRGRSRSSLFPLFPLFLLFPLFPLFPLFHLCHDGHHGVMLH